jgi:predicted acyl esterase
MSRKPWPLLREKDVPVPVADGTVLRANVYRPDAPGRFPVVLAHGVYGKDAHFADAFKPQWEKLNRLYPGLATDGSTGRWLRWEIVDPERWVPDGFVVIQVDARGTGKSPGYVDPFSPAEIRDYADAIEWAGTQPWSNGKVGLIGISYYAITQWLVASLRPPHLAAIVPWEGASDHYRDWAYHGGIPSDTFTEAWWPRQIVPNLHGNAATTHRDRDTGEPTTGQPLPPAIVAGNQADYVSDLGRHPLADAWHAERTAKFERIDVPILSAGNWSGPGIHLRGNIEGWMRAASTRKWLSMHDGTHYESFYLPQYVALQKRFFERFLGDVDNGWDAEPPVTLTIRRPGGKPVRRAEREFPLARTEYVRMHLDAAAGTLAEAGPGAPATRTFTAQGDPIHFTTAPFAADTEFTGFVTLRVWIASSTTDADLFATLRLFDPHGAEVIFDGAHEPVPVARGWLRASHRKIDPARSLPFRVFHAHDAVEKLTPGLPVPLDVEIWPTSVLVPAGYRLGLSLGGRDLEVDGIPGRILHKRGRDTPEFAGITTLMTGADHPGWLVLPRIPG